MRILWWRRKEYDRAKEAMESSEKDRETVEKITSDLKQRGKRNQFAPTMEEALRLRGRHT